MGDLICEHKHEQKDLIHSYVHMLENVHRSFWPKNLVPKLKKARQQLEQMERDKNNLDIKIQNLRAQIRRL